MEDVKSIDTTLSEGQQLASLLAGCSFLYPSIRLGAALGVDLGGHLSSYLQKSYGISSDLVDGVNIFVGITSTLGVTSIGVAAAGLSTVAACKLYNRYTE